MNMPTLKDYREEAGLSISELARRANVDFQTAKKADDQKAIRRIKAIALVRALNATLGTTLKVEDIDGLETE